MIGVGIIGAGGISQSHANGYLQLPDQVEIIAVADLDYERAKLAADRWGAKHAFSDYRQMLQLDQIDAVSVCTFTKAHCQPSIDALTAGKHVLVEKPMATTVEEVRQIGELAEEKGLVAMVGHTFLFNSAVRYVKTLIDSGELGDIRYIYSQRVNLGRIRNDVDALWNFAPHDLSIIHYWLGNLEPLSVSRFGMDYVQDGIEDVVFLSVRYPKKILANIHVSWLDPHKIRKMTVVGSKKMVVYDDTHENKIGFFLSSS